MNRSFKIISAVVILLMMAALVLPEACAGWLGRKYWHFQIIDATTGDPITGGGDTGVWGTLVYEANSPSSASVYSTEMRATGRATRFSTPDSDGVFDFWGGRASYDIIVYNATYWQRYTGLSVDNHRLVFGGQWQGLMPRTTPVISGPGTMWMNTSGDVYILLSTAIDERRESNTTPACITD